MAGVRIRDEAAGDGGTIGAVHAAAFGRAAEGELVEALRRAGALPISLVAEDAGRIVGHVAVSTVTLDPDDEGLPRVAGVGPIGVLPEFQRRGIGSLLMREAARRAVDAGIDALVVLGDPAYYARLGYIDAADVGWRCEYDAPSGTFRVLVLRGGSVGGRRCLVRYHGAFGGVE